MGAEEREQILKVLKSAILRETNAFNYYSKESEDPKMSASVRGVLARLAEEERRHRRLLMNEFYAVKKGWAQDEDAEGAHELSYSLPEILPFMPLEVSADLEGTALSLPGRLVGGDNVFSYVVSDHSGRQAGTLFMLYDVMGHSIETTEINAMAAKVIGEYIEESSSAKMEKELLGPSKVVRRLNRRINEKFEGEGVFLTMFCAYFDCSSGSFKYTCAGHEPPFLIREEGKVGSLLNIQLIVGIDPEIRYREYKVPFEKGDILCVFSDGIIEVRNESDDMFGREGLAEILERSWQGTPEEIIGEMLKGMTEYIRGKPLNDEISIVVIKAKGDNS